MKLVGKKYKVIIMDQSVPNNIIHKRWLPGLLYVLGVILLGLFYYLFILWVIIWFVWLTGNEEGIDDVTPYMGVFFLVICAVPIVFRKKLFFNHYLVVQILVILMAICCLLLGAYNLLLPWG